MKFSKFGRIGLALAVSLGTGLGVTSCSTNHAVGYFYVTGSQYNQISGFRIDNNLGNLTATENSPYASGGYNPIKALVANAGKFLYVLNAGCGQTGKRLSFRRSGSQRRSKHLPVHHRRQGRHQLPGVVYQPGKPADLHAGGFFRHPSVRARFNGYGSHHLRWLCEQQSGHDLWGHHGVQHRPQHRPPFADHQPGSEKQERYQSLVFPVGSGPINFVVVPSNSFIYTIEKGSGSALDPSQAVFVYANSSGQLTLSQNTPIPTAAESLSYIYASSKYVYLIDAGQETATHVRLDLALHHRHQRRPPVAGWRRGSQLRHDRAIRDP